MLLTIPGRPASFLTFPTTSPSQSVDQCHATRPCAVRPPGSNGRSLRVLPQIDHPLLLHHHPLGVKSRPPHERMSRVSCQGEVSRFCQLHKSRFVWVLDHVIFVFNCVHGKTWKYLAGPLCQESKRCPLERPGPNDPGKNTHQLLAYCREGWEVVLALKR